MDILYTKYGHNLAEKDTFLDAQGQKVGNPVLAVIMTSWDEIDVIRVGADVLILVIFLITMGITYGLYSLYVNQGCHR